MKKLFALLWSLCFSLMPSSIFCLSIQEQEELEYFGCDTTVFYGCTDQVKQKVAAATHEEYARLFLEVQLEHYLLKKAPSLLHAVMQRDEEPECGD